MPSWLKPLNFFLVIWYKNDGTLLSSLLGGVALRIDLAAWVLSMVGSEDEDSCCMFDASYDRQLKVFFSPF